MSDLTSGIQRSTNAIDDGDRLGGGGYVWESGVYPVMIDLSYLSKSSGGALALNLVFKDANARELRTIVYLTSADAKGNKDYYVGKDGEEHKLPGTNIGNAISQIVLGIPEMFDVPTEEKVINVWDYSAGGEVATKVAVHTDLLNQRIDIGLQKVIDDKRAKGNDGKYHPTGEHRDSNEIAAIFDANTGMTITESKGGATEAKFKDAWAKKWTDKVVEKFDKSIQSNGTAPSTGAPKTRSLFPNK